LAIPFAADSPLRGIISYLTKTSGGHVMDRGIVSITASNVLYPGERSLRNVADFENQTIFQTKDEANSWIYLDFGKLLIKPTHYSIRTLRNGNSYHLRSWTLESSIDGQLWQEIDRQENNIALNVEGAIATFPISRISEV
jgi:hypothetical protein